MVRLAMVMAVCDSIALGLSGSVAFLLLRIGSLAGTANEWRQMVAMGVVLYLFLATSSGLFAADRFRLVGDRSSGMLKVWAATLFALLAVGLVRENSHAFPLPWLLGWGLIGAVGLAGERILLARWMTRLQATGCLARRVAIVGTRAETEALVRHLSHPDRASEWSIVGLFGPSLSVVDEAFAGLPIGDLEELIVRAPRLHLDTVLLALPMTDRDRINYVCQRLRDLPVDVCVAPDVNLGLPGRPRHVGRETMLGVWTNPLGSGRALAKRTEDLVIGSLMLMTLAPLMLIIAALIRLDSPGPTLLRQRRFGFANDPILVLKFRTMYDDRGDATGARATIPGDTRVTRLGRWLRMTSLDELPQLINVMRGEMSLVGPRPHPVEMTVGGVYYHDAVLSYRARHRVKPGITGLAQINGSRGLVDTLEKAQRRLDYDLHYVENWSIGLDLRILCATLYRGCIHPDAY